jgi:hypothetical protein
MTKAGRYRGFDADGVAESEADYFGYCPVCGAYIDTRDLARWRTSMMRKLRSARVRRSKPGSTCAMSSLLRQNV